MSINSSLFMFRQIYFYWFSKATHKISSCSAELSKNKREKLFKISTINIERKIFLWWGRMSLISQQTLRIYFISISLVGKFSCFVLQKSFRGLRFFGSKCQFSFLSPHNSPRSRNRPFILSIFKLKAQPFFKG